tara:strand:- start:1671 stop:1778 length:108 start_codon:yes stop_codon:yes gene_type:complete
MEEQMRDTISLAAGFTLAAPFIYLYIQLIINIWSQ